VVEQPGAGTGVIPDWPAASARRPKVVVKADLVPAISVASFVVLVGPVLGWLWSRLAPPLRAQVTTGNQLLASPEESYHRFDGVAIFIMLALVAGLLVGAAVWLLRERRGPVVLLAATLGSVFVGILGRWIGGSLVVGRYAITSAPKVGDMVAQAPAISSGWVILVAPFGVALAYGTLAAWNGMHDLGRRLG
jgi:Protein of unknown function (DUF2567)